MAALSTHFNNLCAAPLTYRILSFGLLRALVAFLCLFIFTSSIRSDGDNLHSWLQQSIFIHCSLTLLRVAMRAPEGIEGQRVSRG